MGVQGGGAGVGWGGVGGVATEISTCLVCELAGVSRMRGFSISVCPGGAVAGGRGLWHRVKGSALEAFSCCVCFLSFALWAYEASQSPTSHGFMHVR